MTSITGIGIDWTMGRVTSPDVEQLVNRKILAVILAGIGLQDALDDIANTGGDCPNAEARAALYRKQLAS